MSAAGQRSYISPVIRKVTAELAAYDDHVGGCAPVPGSAPAAEGHRQNGPSSRIRAAASRESCPTTDDIQMVRRPGVELVECKERRLK
jgi:hypothetical protein